MRERLPETETSAEKALEAAVDAVPKLHDFFSRDTHFSRDYVKKQLKAAIQAYLSTSPSTERVMVKALEWDDTSKFRSTTETLIGTFWAEEELGDEGMWVARQMGYRAWKSEGHKSRADAKAAIQQYHDAIILSALVCHEERAALGGKDTP